MQSLRTAAAMLHTQSESSQPPASAAAAPAQGPAPAQDAAPAPEPPPVRVGLPRPSSSTEPLAQPATPTASTAFSLALGMFHSACIDARCVMYPLSLRPARASARLGGFHPHF